MRILPLRLLVVFCLLQLVSHAQTGNFGVGYGVGWYYLGVKNVKASMVAFNTDKDYLSERASAKTLDYGFTVTMKGNRLGMIFPISVLKNKSEFSGTNPGTGNLESYTISNLHVSWGLGWRIDRENTCIAIVLNQGIAGYRYKSTGTGVHDEEWQSLPGWPVPGQYSMMYGTTMFYEFFPMPRIGLRFSWYAHLLATEGIFGRSESRHKFSQVQACLTFYMRKQYGR